MSSIRKSNTISKASSKASIRGQKSRDSSASIRDYISLHSNDRPRDCIERLTNALNDSDLEEKAGGEVHEATADSSDLGEDFDESNIEGSIAAGFEAITEGVTSSDAENVRKSNDNNGFGMSAFALGSNTSIHRRQDSRTSSGLRSPRDDVWLRFASTEVLNIENDEDEDYEGDGMSDYSSQFDGQYQRKMGRFARNPNATASELSNSTDSDFEDEAEDTGQGYISLSSPHRRGLQELLRQEEDEQISVCDAEEEPENSRSSSVEFILNDSSPPNQWPSTAQRTSATQHPFFNNSISAPRGFSTNENRAILQPRYRLPHNPSNSHPNLFENHSSSASYSNMIPDKNPPSSPSNKLLTDFNYSYAKDPRPRLRHMLLCDNCKKMGHRWMHCLGPCVLCGNLGHGIHACGKGRKRVNEDELDLDDVDSDMEKDGRGGEVGFKRIKWEPETEKRRGKLVIYE